MITAEQLKARQQGERPTNRKLSEKLREILSEHARDRSLMETRQNNERVELLEKQGAEIAAQTKLDVDAAEAETTPGEKP